MAPFQGFPTRAQRQTPLPNLFFTAVLPGINDLVELKVTLHLFWKLSWKKGYPRYITLKEMEADHELMAGLGSEGRESSSELASGLERVLQNGTFLHLAIDQGSETEDLYFLNTDLDQRAIEKVHRGELDLGGLPKIQPAAVSQFKDHNIYGIYEENIGVLTPMIMDELRDAEKLYPSPWIIEAFKEAARLNHRQWRYVQRILETWAAEGYQSGQDQRHSKKTPEQRRNPATQAGGYLVKRRRS